MTSESQHFDWRLMADATCAGLAVLVPVPLADILLERLFRRRIVASICQVRCVTPNPKALAALGSGEPLVSVRGCVAVPLALLGWGLKRLSRKLLYFLTIREAANALCAYWHRAYVIDHMAQAGHLAPDMPAEPAVAALNQAVRETDRGALSQLARQLLRGSHHVMRRLLRARSRGATGELAGESAFLAGQWATMVEQLDRAVVCYQAIYTELVLEASPTAAQAVPDVPTGRCPGEP